MRPAESFLTELAARWTGRPLILRIIGATALTLQADHQRGTRDADVLETTELDDETRALLLALAGPGAELAERWRLYVQIVRNGIPFLPRPPLWCPVELPSAPPTIKVFALDVVDVVVSKLKRFAPHDKADIEAMIRADRVPHDLLVRRFLSAVDGFLGDARESELPRYVANLNEVERDLLGVDETEVELPDWID